MVPMLTRLDLRGVTGDLRSQLPRPAAAADPPVAEVQAIIAAVPAGGHAALRRLSERFDGVAVDELRVPQVEIDSALAAIPPLLREALEAARASILAFHREQLPAEGRHERDGLVVRAMHRPVDRAGLYVPGSV